MIKSGFLICIREKEKERKCSGSYEEVLFFFFLVLSDF
jgi:hypothetical protein